jgi:hypothetical protein
LSSLIDFSFETGFEIWAGGVGGVVVAVVAVVAVLCVVVDSTVAVVAVVALVSVVEAVSVFAGEQARAISAAAAKMTFFKGASSFGGRMLSVVEDRHSTLTARLAR